MVICIKLCNISVNVMLINYSMWGLGTSEGVTAAIFNSNH